jgi:hypothetical protein
MRSTSLVAITLIPLAKTCPAFQRGACSESANMAADAGGQCENGAADMLGERVNASRAHRDLW